MFWAFFYVKNLTNHPLYLLSILTVRRTYPVWFLLGVFCGAKMGLFFESWKNLFIWVVLVLIALAFTWHVVSWSEQHGKLAMPPDYDDSHSLVEGAVRLLNFQNSGLGAAWDEYRLRNPHSFLHYYWTAALFAGFGIPVALP